MNKLGFILAGGLGKRMGRGVPKVLRDVDGRPMVNRAVDALRDGGAECLIAVLSHRSDLVADALPPDVEILVQERPRGTASALIDAAHLIPDRDTAIIVGYGDMPWLNPRSVRRLLDAVIDGADAAVLTYEFDDPPHFGRIVRDATGQFQGIVEFKDCTAEQRAIRELNAGLFAFRASSLKPALATLDSCNSANEYYLTDVPGRLAHGGGRVDCIAAERIEETLGVNDPIHLLFANQLPDLEKAERLLQVADRIFGGTGPAGRLDPPRR